MSDETAPAAAEAAPAPEAAAAPVEAAPAPVEPEKPTAEAWATLRRNEERLRRMSEEHKSAAKAAEERQAKLDARAAELEAEAKRFDLATYGGSRAKMAEALGLSYDEWTVEMLNREGTGGAKPKPNPELDAIRSELAALKAEREAEVTTREQAAESERWSNIMRAVGETVAPPASGEHTYELLHHELASNAEHVSATLQEMAQRDPKLTVQQAADLYEAWLLDQTKARLGLSKVRALLSPAGEPKPSHAPQAKPGEAASPNGRTALSAQDSSERATDPSPPKEWHAMTLKERRDWERAGELRAARALEERSAS